MPRSRKRARMQYTTFSPSPDLAPFIECYWTLHGVADAGALPERILPDGCIELIFNFADPFEEVTGKGRCQVQPTALLAGQLTRYLLARPTGAIDLVAIRFRPAGAAALLPHPLDGFTNTTLSAVEVDPCWGTCRETLGNSPRPQRITVLEELLRADTPRPFDGSMVRRVVREMVRKSGNVVIEDLAYQAGVSVSALQRAFRRHVGLSPKPLARIFRVQTALEMRRRIPALTVSEIAHRCGYFDHAHFTRDFSAITGQPPTVFFRSEHELSDLLTSTG